MSNYNAMRELIKEMSGQDNVFTVPKIYVRFTGDLTTAILLNQIVFYSDKSKRDDGYFYKKYSEWESEICLTERQVRYSSNKLKAMGFLETKLFKVNGSPTLHYKLDFDKLLDSILTFCQIPTLQDVSNVSDNLSVSSYTENTTENTNSSRKQAFDEDSPVTKIVNFFVEEIRKNRPDFKGHSQTWFTDTDRILRLDNRDPKEVCRVIRFAQADDFWKANILSPKKLRQHYDALAIKLQQTNQKQKAGTAPVAYKPVELDLNAGED